LGKLTQKAQMYVIALSISKGVMIVKRLFALLVALVMVAGVLSVYAEDACSVPGQGTDYTQIQQKAVKKARKIKKHHKHKKSVKKIKEAETEISVTAEPDVK
jgi:hypothetical protein